MNGLCVCEVQFDGYNCAEPNLGYYVAFATIFFCICLVSITQLIICIHSEYKKMKPGPSVVKACRVTTQKAIYLIIAMASFIRGLHFSFQGSTEWGWVLLSAYFPLLLTGYSIIICFWAEIFHLQDVRLNPPRFLDKSFGGFLGFNIITYSILLTEVILILVRETSEIERNYLTNIFYGAYAILMFVVVVFFLFYGVEVYFKIRGGFTDGHSGNTDNSQLHQSRFGLVFQACMLLITVGFLLSDICGEFWKYKVHVLSRNWHMVLFRLAELSVALWFPCVLWNCISPEQLWILNPQRLLKQLDDGNAMETPESEALFPDPSRLRIEPAADDELASVRGKLPDCWICYDSERDDAGPLIQPCLCKGDVGAVHHDCLRKWLMESIQSANKAENLQCKVCQQPYKLEKGRHCFPAGFTKRNWLQTVALITCMCGALIGAWTALHFCDKNGIRIMAVGTAVLVSYVCLKFMGFNVVTAYQRAKVSAVRIIGPRFSFSQVPTTETTVSTNPQSQEFKINVIHFGGPKRTADEETRL